MLGHNKLAHSLSYSIHLKHMLVMMNKHSTSKLNQKLKIIYISRFIAPFFKAISADKMNRKAEKIF